MTNDYLAVNRLEYNLVRNASNGIGISEMVSEMVQPTKVITNGYVLADVALLCPLDDESIDSDDTLLVADIIDAFGGVISRPSELCCEKLHKLKVAKEKIS